MDGRRVQVIAPSRLHFGMLSFGHHGIRQFGGVGAMIAAPGLRLVISASEGLEVVGPLSDRAREFALRVGGHAPWTEGAPRCRIEILDAPRQHIGLGSGTQLGMAVALGLNAFFGGPWSTASEFAGAIGRGRRSAIGIHGALLGGLVLEAGKYLDGDRGNDQISPLVGRVALPEPWRFVLLSPAGEEGLSGHAERQAFAKLPPVPLATTGTLCRELLLELLPAAATGDFERFSEGLYRFGRAAGQCFASQQAGIYGSPRQEQLVRLAQASGVRGVSQTSWGPTVFALLPDEAAATAWVREIRSQPSAGDLDVTIAAPSKEGTRLVVKYTDAG